MAIRRQSQAEGASVVTEEDLRAQSEAENGLRQFDRVLDYIDEVERGERPFRLRPSMVLDLHRVAMDGLETFAGAFRPGAVEIGGSRHEPPHASLVAKYVEEMCDWVNDNAHLPALRLCAYVMWRLNWIHPFTDGNGRTSRAVAYYVLCARLGGRLPGNLTIPAQIAGNRDSYYRALEAADQGATDSDPTAGLGKMEQLLETALRRQLADVMSSATAGIKSTEG